MADREPSGDPGRLDVVHPGTLPQADHAQHDRWLVVRAASHDDDLTAVETTTADALLASCRDCAALAADIATISHATTVSVAPVRQRDFRLTPAQAASANGGFLARLGRWLASPRGTVLRPLAGASLAIGIVLVVVSPTVRGPIQPPVQPPTAIGGAPAGGAPVATASEDPVLTMQLQAPRPSQDSATTPEMMDTQPKASDSSAMTTSGAAESPDVTGDTRMAKSSLEPTAPASGTPDPETAGLQAGPGSTQAPDAREANGSIEAQRRSADATTTALTLLGIVLVGTGILVLLLTWLVRRMTRDPLLPG